MEDYAAGAHAAVDLLAWRHGVPGDLALRQRIVEGGRLHIGTTMLGGRRHLRVVMMAPATGEETLRTLREELHAAPLAV